MRFNNDFKTLATFFLKKGANGLWQSAGAFSVNILGTLILLSLLPALSRAQSPDANLANLSLSKGTLSPAFNPDSVNYTAKINIVKKDHTVYTMGDSITATGEYPFTLASLLKGKFYIVNAAITGAVTSVMINRFSTVTNAAPDFVIILGGIDDIDHLSGAGAVGIENNLQTMYTAARNAGSKVIAITITPDKGSLNWNLTRQAQLDSVNTWMLTAQNLDYLVDGYTALEDPANPGQLLPAYDRGDHLHPNLAGQNVLAAAIVAGVPFTPNPLTDQINAANSSVAITPVTQDQNATVTVNGTTVKSGSPSGAVALSLGTNAIVTRVTAQDGTIKNYTINITGAPSNDANLAIMAASTSGNTLAPVFDPNITSYTASVPHDSTVVRIKLSAVDSDATVKLNGVAVKNGKAPLLNLALGPNIMNIVVTAADKVTQKIYTLNEMRLYSSNDNLEVMKPSVGGLTPYFSSETMSYTSRVPAATTAITITPNTADPNATVTVNDVLTALGAASAPITLGFGQNIINTVVTAQDGVTKKTYTLTVTRDAASSNSDLSRLTISAGSLTPAFTKATTSCRDIVNNGITSVTVTPTADDQTATITVNGTAVKSGHPSGALALSVGVNTINIVVTAQDGVSADTYTVAVDRAASNNGGYQTGILVHQGVSPNSDGIDDFLQIDNIGSYPDNDLKIINRDGTLVYETKGYDNATKVFDGHSSQTGLMLLPGIYFYELDYTDTGITQRKLGFLVLKY